MGRPRAWCRSGLHRPGGIGEDGQDLLVSGMAGQYRRRRPGRPGGGLAGQREQGRAGDPQMTGRLAGLAEPGLQVTGHGAGLLGLTGQGLLACVDLVQQQPARVLSGH
jgi:hypothetical protein